MMTSPKRIAVIKLFLIGIFLFGVAFAAPQPPDERLFDAKLDTIRTRLDGMDTAIKLKAEETERRLEGLNELRSDVVKDRDQFVRKDVFESKVKEYDDVARRLAAMESRMIAWGAAAVVVFGLANFGAHLWNKKKREP